MENYDIETDLLDIRHEVGYSRMCYKRRFQQVWEYFNYNIERKPNATHTYRQPEWTFLLMNISQKHALHIGNNTE